MNTSWKTVGIRMALIAAMIAMGASCASTHVEPLPGVPPGATAKDELGSIGSGAYVVLNSPNNEIVLPNGKRWTGRVRGIRDLMLVRDNTITPATEVPEAMQSSYQVMVDFQRNGIKYSFFDVKEGGVYPRK
ncbi:hypothetical protein BGE01nite_50160 [Brevifollis gellanilyticus]|uniref:Lipoprotein n=2 Tax=Brevifollis gellanilyticus TaxID=748831 RepID=A0A512MG66_9BACT|nr:hypothetical protein BGE01nite_50160 [Brevifollis gellanilyticus]